MQLFGNGLETLFVEALEALKNTFLQRRLNDVFVAHFMIYAMIHVKKNEVLLTEIRK